MQLCIYFSHYIISIIIWKLVNQMLSLTKPRELWNYLEACQSELCSVGGAVQFLPCHLASVPDPKPTLAWITNILEVIYMPDEVWGAHVLQTQSLVNLH